MKFKCELSSEIFRVDKCNLWDDVWNNLYKEKQISKLKEVYHKFEFDDTKDKEVEEKDRVYNCRTSEELEYKEFLKSAKRSKLIEEIYRLKKEIKYYEDRVKYYEREDENIENEVIISFNK